ncbi:MAG TPA: asparagine synthase (glutamine-hydrolyzing) [Candidatus Sulfotelmatobacter sp.]|nr:asparagine synthase (glutamine-hydrolyzing) [Candidatus Sulfotelmatobacter sp.]
MCGIVGFTHKRWVPESDRIQRAVATLIHRGPDQQGVFESSPCSLGATRLKILDLDSGDQPIVSEDGNVAIAFNGEIYNHQELRRELQKLGHRFYSSCDTETVLHAFLEWDTACFARLRGMFAVALWTKSKQRLVLARDRLGIKPLYFARHGEDLFFGSELKAILIHPQIERRLSLDGLDCYLSLNYVPGPWTLVQGIEKLPPGRWLQWRDGEISSEAYWSLPFGAARDRSLDAAKEELDSLLRQSVREHLLSDVPLGVWLSGGIDSSTILHYAAESGLPLKTFSISFQGRNFDESSYIHQIVDLYQTDHEELDLNPTTDLRDAIEQLAYYSDEPSADAGAVPVWFLARLSKTKTTVNLSGEGADELFGGYLTHRANRLAARARRFGQAPLKGALSAVNHLWPVSDDKISFEYQLKRFLEGCLMPPERAHTYWNGTFSDAQKAPLLRSQLPPALPRILGKLRDKISVPDDLAPYLWFDQSYFLPDDILTKTDRMSMAHALEVRPPFLDHRIVEFAASLPASLKIRGSKQKFILKELMRDRLPTSILERKKVGFDIPVHDWLRGCLRGLMTDVLLDNSSLYAGLIHKQKIETYIRQHLERKINVGYHLWGLMMLFLWMKKWGIQATDSREASLCLPQKTGTYS